MIGTREAGSLIERANAVSSIVGIGVMNQMITKTITAVVDQGSEAAIKVG
jgi:hypothetical protein